MILYPDMFFSKWHIITLAMIIVAWIAFIVGGYERRVILRSGALAVIPLHYYNDSYHFRGRLTLWAYNEQGEEINKRTYEDLNLAPGEVKEIDSYYSSTKLKEYRYRFEPLE